MHKKEENDVRKTYFMINHIKLFFYLFILVSLLLFLFVTMSLITSVIIAFLIAYILNPIISFFEKKNIPRPISIVLLCILLLIVGLLSLKHIKEIIPTQNDMEKFYLKIVELLGNWKDFLNKKIALINWDNLYNQVVEFLFLNKNMFFSKVMAFLIQIAENISTIFFVTLSTFFFLLYGRQMKKKLIELVPNKYFELSLTVIEEIDKTLGNYIRGTLLESLFMAFFSTVGFYITGFPFLHSIIGGVIVGVTNVIPYIGPLIGAIGTSLIVLLDVIPPSFDSIFPWKTSVLAVILVNLIVQLLDNVVLKPVIIGESVKLHPFLVVIAAIGGAKCFGGLGLLLAIPVVAIIKNSIQTLYKQLRGFGLLTDNLFSIITVEKNDE